MFETDIFTSDEGKSRSNYVLAICSGIDSQNPPRVD